jgi:hypothetical protein
LACSGKERGRFWIPGELFIHPHLVEENQIMKGPRKIIVLEEHCGLPFTNDTAREANDLHFAGLDALRKEY